MTNFTSILSGKRVFLTGHTGFKGAWASIWLKHLGAHVTAYSMDPPTSPSLYQVADVGKVVDTDIRADIRSREELSRAMSEAEPDLIIHMAAQSVVSYGYEHPFETLSVNAMGTASVLEAVRDLGRPVSVLCITSDKCYENVEQVWGYKETDKMGDSDPYGGSKGCAEIVVNFYRSSFFPVDKISDHKVRLASARAGNVIGGGDWKNNALLCDAYRHLDAGTSIPLRNPASFRPWQHVLQCLSGYLTLCARLLAEDDTKYCSGWNIGPLPGSELPVSTVIDQFIDEWGEGAWHSAIDANQKREAQILRLSIDKAIWELEWTPGWTTQTAIKKTAQWYKQFSQGQNPVELCERQIVEYTDAMTASDAPI